LRHSRLARPLELYVDGKSSQGIIIDPAENPPEPAA
jgi:hypothetical protein